VARAASLSAAAALGFGFFPAISQASVGVGVQVNPVRLANPAHAGASYSLPSVHVANTGTQAESVSVRVERLSRGTGRIVPPSWIQAEHSPLRLSPDQQASIPLRLAVPAGAKAGRYFSDIVIIGSAIVAAGSANFGAAAATKLEFRVVPGPAKQPWSFPAWGWWAVATVITLACGRIAWRSSGLRIRIERTRTGRSSA
jgi:hypothetical protein